jgi:hypothetical protein
MYCTRCGAVRRDVALASIAVLVSEEECCDCGCTTEHLPIVNGGIKTRFRQQDWPSDPAFYRGQVTCSPPGCKVDETGEAVSDLSGQPVQAREKFTSEDRRAERRDEQYHATDRKLGKTPLVFDGGKHSRAE